jgi:hypothetical protein
MVENGGLAKALESDDTRPWQSRVPRGYWTSIEHRLDAIKWLVQKTGKKPHEILKDDFINNGLGGLLTGYYHNSPYNALTEAGQLPSDFKPWRMEGGVSKGYWDSKENRAVAIVWLATRTGKKLGELTTDDYAAHGLGNLLKLYNNSPLNAISGLITI